MAATIYGIPGCDDLVPDDSEEGAQACRAEVGAADLEQITPADAVTLDCTKEAATQELAIIVQSVFFVRAVHRHAGSSWVRTPSMSSGSEPPM